jgi:hypothetical protein
MIYREALGSNCKVQRFHSRDAIAFRHEIGTSSRIQAEIEFEEQTPLIKEREKKLRDLKDRLHHRLTSPDKEIPLKFIDTAIFATNHQIYAEALDSLFTHNTVYGVPTFTLAQRWETPGSDQGSAK